MDWLEKFPPNEQKSFGKIQCSIIPTITKNGEKQGIFFKLLLKNDLRNSSEESIRSYIACCAEASGAVHPLPDLKNVVEEFYGQYGMENSTSIES